jgi:three-Cys-motif partner protein
VVEHRYGGPWTEVKLDAVDYYLGCYTKALSRAFDLWYFDAFAGTGDRTVDVETGGIFDGRPIATETLTLDGSARRALKIVPPFHHFVFIEQDPERYEALRALKAEFPQLDIRCIAADANRALVELVTRRPWHDRDNGRARGVVFLDPYALHVEWKTLEVLASTKALDVWYLFPLRDVTRQLAHDYTGVGVKEPRMDLILGPQWRDLYAKSEDRQTELFDVPVGPGMRRAVTQRGVESWFKGRLESIFEYASDPMPILTAPGRHTFSLFLALANPSRKAVDLAHHFAGYVRRYFGS